LDVAAKIEQTRFHPNTTQPLMFPMNLLLSLLLIVGISLTTAHAPISIKTAKNYVILSETGITTNSDSKVVGNMAVYPAFDSAIVGFGLKETKSKQFSTSLQVHGEVYASNNTRPTPSKLARAVQDFEKAYNYTSTLDTMIFNANDGYFDGDGDQISLPPMTFTWPSDLTINTTIWLGGPSSSVWIFQVKGSLVMHNNFELLLFIGAKASNVFWQVSGDVTIGSNSKFVGVILGGGNVELKTGASVKGRIFTKGSVKMDGNLVSPT
jgi:hypothetical protein